MTVPSRLARFARGIKVLDLSAFLPGPLASLLLADMGAEVLKIEPPTGDAMTLLGPRDAADQPVFYNAVNAGKSVRRMDLKNPAQRAEFLGLVADCDVLIEGFRPGVMQRLGLGYAALRDENPGLIYCALSGFGAGGPMAEAAGHDANYLAASGVLHRNGCDGGPIFYDPPIADVSGSLFGVIAILGALRARDADGLGCEIDIGLADTPMTLQQFQVAEYGVNGNVPARRTTYLNGGAAYYQVYATSDGRHIAVGAVEPKFWAAFCNAAGRPDWIERQGETLPQASLIADVREHLATLTSAECDARFADGDCCTSAVLDLGEAIASPHHRARGLVRAAPDGALQALFPARIDGLPPASRPPPRPSRDAASLSDHATAGHT
jgi:crotonobetainyl-CoA:carnitine CoA-transferase CaiB-like acyl-CoA transferase